MAGYKHDGLHAENGSYTARLPDRAARRDARRSSRSTATPFTPAVRARRGDDPSARTTRAVATRRRPGRPSTTSASPARSATGSSTTRPRATRWTSPATTTCGSSSIGQLAVDLGGIHTPVERLRHVRRRRRAAKLRPDRRPGLRDGRVPGRTPDHLRPSYRLTLSGFNAAPSECTPICGDGIVSASARSATTGRQQHRRLRRVQAGLQAGPILRRRHRPTGLRRLRRRREDRPRGPLPVGLPAPGDQLGVPGAGVRRNNLDPPSDSGSRLSVIYQVAVRILGTRTEANRRPAVSGDT